MSLEEMVNSGERRQESLRPNREESRQRQRSRVDFPYHDLATAMDVARGVHAVGGTSCSWDQLAAHFHASAKGGAFRVRLATAKTFGLLAYDKGMVSLLPLGSRICDPRQEAAAKVEAFLTVPLYKQIHDRFKGSTLPPNSGLESSMVELGVAPKQKSKARQVFSRSASQAGFFGYGDDRLVAPSLNQKEVRDDVREAESQDQDEVSLKKRHPLIDGLIETLPEAGAEWAIQDRGNWLLAASNIFNLIFSDPGDKGKRLTITWEDTGPANTTAPLVAEQVARERRDQCEPSGSQY